MNQPERRRTAGDYLFYAAVTIYFIVAAVAIVMSLGLHAGIAIGF